MTVLDPSLFYKLHYFVVFFFFFLMAEQYSTVYMGYKTSLVALTVKRLSTMWEIPVRSLGWEDPLEKEMAIHSSTIASKFPRTEEAGRL